MAEGKNLNFRTQMGHVRIILSANFGGNRSCDAGFRAQNWNLFYSFKQL